MIGTLRHPWPASSLEKFCRVILPYNLWLFPFQYLPYWVSEDNDDFSFFLEGFSDVLCIISIVLILDSFKKKWVYFFQFLVSFYSWWVYSSMSFIHLLINYDNESWQWTMENQKKNRVTKFVSNVLKSFKCRLDYVWYNIFTSKMHKRNKTMHGLHILGPIKIMHFLLWNGSNNIFTYFERIKRSKYVIYSIMYYSRLLVKFSYPFSFTPMMAYFSVF